MGHKSHYISACWDSNSCFSEGSGYLIDTHFPLSLLLNKDTTVPIQAWRLHVTINLNSCSCRSHFSTSPCKSISHTSSKINNELLSRCISCCVSNFWQECLHGGGGCLHQGSLCQNEVPMPHNHLRDNCKSSPWAHGTLPRWLSWVLLTQAVCCRNTYSYHNYVN